MTSAEDETVGNMPAGIPDEVHGPLVPETDRDPAPVVGVDVPPEPPVMADGEPFPEPVAPLEARRKP